MGTGAVRLLKLTGRNEETRAMRYVEARRGTLAFASSRSSSLHPNPSSKHAFDASSL